MDETVWNDLGPASSYALAVAHGFTGTEEEWVNANDIAREAALNAKEAAENAKEAAETAADKAKEQADKIAEQELTSDKNAKLAESYAHGNTGLDERPDEDTDNAKAYMEKAKEYADNAKAIVGADVMQGATDTEDGVGGYVPAPRAGDNNRFLAGDGTYKDVNMDSKADGPGIKFEVIGGIPYMTYDDSLVYEDGQLVREVSDADIDNAIDETFDDDPTNDAPPDEAIDNMVDEIFNS